MTQASTLAKVETRTLAACARQKTRAHIAQHQARHTAQTVAGAHPISRASRARVETKLPANVRSADAARSPPHDPQPSTTAPAAPDHEQDRGAQVGGGSEGSHRAAVTGRAQTKHGAARAVDEARALVTRAGMRGRRQRGRLRRRRRLYVLLRCGCGGSGAVTAAGRATAAGC